VKGPKQEEKQAPAVDTSAASSPELVLKRLVPVPSPSHAGPARGVMAYAAQAAVEAAGKSAVAAPAALIEMA